LRTHYCILEFLLMEPRGSSLWLLLSTYPPPPIFFYEGHSGIPTPEAQLSSSVAAAKDNDNSRPPKSCKGQCVLLLVETVGKKNNIRKLEITPIVFNIPRLSLSKYAHPFVVVREIHTKKNSSAKLQKTLKTQPN